ncbi:MAG: hypothetical protein KDA22_12560 [Phycisphaerales bacterium]|nr:hypothetical protein [Phycisphaerales bacterium]
MPALFWTWGEPGPPPPAWSGEKLAPFLFLHHGYIGLGRTLSFTFEQWLALNGVTDAQDQMMLARLYRWWVESGEG